MEPLRIHGRLLPSANSPAMSSKVVFIHEGNRDPVDYEREAQDLLLFLSEHLPPATRMMLDWGVGRDLARDVADLRAENARLQRLNESLMALQEQPG